MFDVLKSYGLSTIDDCKDSIPIIIQSFELDALVAFESLTDLPRVMLTHYPDEQQYDYEEVAKYAHGVGPPSEVIMNEDPDDDKYSEYIA